MSQDDFFNLLCRQLGKEGVHGLIPEYLEALKAGMEEVAEKRRNGMSVSLYLWNPDVCEGHKCVGDCDFCAYAEEAELVREEEDDDL